MRVLKEAKIKTVPPMCDCEHKEFECIGCKATVSVEEHELERVNGPTSKQSRDGMYSFHCSSCDSTSYTWSYDFTCHNRTIEELSVWFPLELTMAIAFGAWLIIVNFLIPIFDYLLQ